MNRFFLDINSVVEHQFPFWNPFIQNLAKNSEICLMIPNYANKNDEKRILEWIKLNKPKIFEESIRLFDRKNKLTDEKNDIDFETFYRNGIILESEINSNEKGAIISFNHKTETRKDVSLKRVIPLKSSTFSLDSISSCLDSEDYFLSDHFFDEIVFNDENNYDNIHKKLSRKLFFIPSSLDISSLPEKKEILNPKNDTRNKILVIYDSKEIKENEPLLFNKYQDQYLPNQMFVLKKILPILAENNLFRLLDTNFETKDIQVAIAKHMLESKVVWVINKSVHPIYSIFLLAKYYNCIAKTWYYPNFSLIRSFLSGIEFIKQKEEKYFSIREKFQSISFAFKSSDYESQNDFRIFDQNLFDLAINPISTKSFISCIQKFMNLETENNEYSNDKRDFLYEKFSNKLYSCDFLMQKSEIEGYQMELLKSFQEKIANEKKI